MKVLKAPTPITTTRIISIGEPVKFVEGIATEFTEAQAAHFQKISGAYEVIDLDDPKAETSEETSEETAEDIKVKIAFAKSEEEKRKKKAEADEKAKRNKEQEEAIKAKKLEDENKADADRLKKEADDKIKKTEDAQVEKEANDKKADEERQKKEDEKKAVKIPDETTPYPRLVEIIKKFKIPTPSGRNAGELLKAILANENFKKAVAPE